MAPKKLRKWEGKEEFFKRRFPGFKKKLTELPLLCGYSAVLVCYGPDNKVDVWPEPQAVSQMFARFNSQTDLKKEKNTCHVDDFGHDLLDDALVLDQIDSFLVGFEQHKIGVIRYPIRVSDHKLGLEDVIGTNLNLGFDELGYVVSDDSFNIGNWGLAQGAYHTHHPFLFTS